MDDDNIFTEEDEAMLREVLDNQKPPLNPTDKYYEYGQTEDNALDKNTIMFIRTAKIWNPNLNNLNPVSTNNLEVKSAVNESTGKVLLTLNLSGFVSPTQQDMTDYTDISYNPEDRTLDEVKNTSNEEKIPLTYPFIWVGQDSWCGYNYLPPLNSEVIIGFGRKHNAYILGYINPQYKACTPYLKPGELCMKGAGNNYIHNRWSNKLDLKAWAVAGDQDRDSASREESAQDDCTLWIRMDADNGHIEISATGGGEGKMSGIWISPDGVNIVVQGKTIFGMDSGGITMTGSTISESAGHVDKNAPREDSNQ